MKKLQKRTNIDRYNRVHSACNCLGGCTCGMSNTVYTQATAIRKNYTWIR
jgi:hypothetical protein